MIKLSMKRFKSGFSHLEVNETNVLNCTSSLLYMVSKNRQDIELLKDTLAFQIELFDFN